MKKIELKSRKLLRTIFGCISFTAVAFVFQACYGTEGDMFYDVRLTGTVKSVNTNAPIGGIKVMVNDGDNGRSLNYGITDHKGNFDFYASVPDRNWYEYHGGTYYNPDSVKVQFLDIDGILNGNFADKTIYIAPAHKDEVKINVMLNEIK